VSSTFCICRALVEAFDALAYVAIEEVTDTERDFRVLLWRLHAEDRKLQALQLIKSTRPEAAQIQAEVERLRQELRVSPYIATLSEPERKELKGKKIPPFHIRTLERNRRNGVDHEYYTASYILLSAHTHTYPLALQQLSSFEAGDPESLRLISLPTQYSLGFLSKAIDGILSIFAVEVSAPPSGILNVLDIWTTIVEQGLPTRALAQ